MLLLIYDFHAFPCTMKVEKSLYIMVWDNGEHMGKSLGGILFVVNNRPLSQPFLCVWKAVGQLQAAWCIWKINHPLCYLTISILNLTEECWSWLLGHSSSWVNKARNVICLCKVKHLIRGEWQRKELLSTVAAARIHFKGFHADVSKLLDRASLDWDPGCCCSCATALFVTM